MRMVTFNMRNGDSKLRWRELLQRTQPDVAFVQETKAPATFPPELLDAHDISTAVWVPAPHGKWGTALWTGNRPLETLALAGKSWWAAGAIVESRGVRFLACSVHLGVAVRGAYIGSANAFLDQLQELKIDLPMVVGGDWNLTVGERQPDEELTFSKRGMQLLGRMRDEFGLVSGWSLCNPGLPLPQTLRFAKYPELPFHCDGIFVSSGWHQRVRAATVMAGEPWASLSDHRPVIVDMELPGAS
jgi:exonuclease III